MHIYDNKAKQGAREAVHDILARAASPTNKIMVLAGCKRHEIDEAVRRGWGLENIEIVEKDTCKMANFTRQFSKRERLVIKSNQYRDIASNVCKKIVAGGARIQAIHLDFTDPIESFQPSSPRFEIEEIVRSG